MSVCDSVSCDIHSAMRAPPFVTRAPYVVQVPDTGTFNFRDVVPGSYKVSGFIEGTSIDQTLEISGRNQAPGPLKSAGLSRVIVSPLQHRITGAGQLTVLVATVARAGFPIGTSFSHSLKLQRAIPARRVHEL